MTVNFQTSNIYHNFYKKVGINPPQTTNAKNQDEKTIPSVKIGDIQDAVYRRKLFGVIGISAGSIFLLAIITFFTLTKGFSGSIGKKLKSISEKAKKHIYDLTTQSKHLTNKQKIQLRINKVVQSTADTMQASSNISAVKDSFIQHWLNKMHIDKIINKINNVFKNIVLKTKNNNYQSAEYSVIDFCNYLENIAKQQPNSPLSQSLKEKAEKILELYLKDFSSIEHIKRTNKFWENTKGLDEKVYNLLFKPEGGVFKNLKRFSSYVTTDLVAKERTNYVNQITRAKKEISNSLSDVNAEIKQALFNLKTTVNTKNNKAVEIVKEISEIVESNKAINGINEEISRKQLFETLKVKLDKLAKTSLDMQKSKEISSLTLEKIEKFKKILEKKEYQKGLAQEAITDIKKLFETNGGKNSIEYKQAKKLLESMNTKLNTAIDCENLTYEKLAELQVGSAPSDVLGILVPTAIGTAMIVNADDKNERISSTLTKGIPILGGVGFSYYGTTRGFTGVKNLSLSLVTGYLLNVLGEQADKFVKSHRKEQEKLRKAFEAFTKMQKASTKTENKAK